jgi:hypothetical protein
MRVYEQPTRKDVAELLRKGSGKLRAVRDTRDGALYVWDADEALHDEALRYLGLIDVAESMGIIHRIADFDWMAALPRRLDRPKAIELLKRLAKDRRVSPQLRADAVRSARLLRKTTPKPK